MHAHSTVKRLLLFLLGAIGGLVSTRKHFSKYVYLF